MMAWLIDLIPWWVYWLGIGIAALHTFQLWFPIALAVWNLLPGWARAALIGVAAVFTALIYGRNQGRKNEIARQKERDRHAIENREKSDRRIDKIPDSQLDKELDPWFRPDK